MPLHRPILLALILTATTDFARATALQPSEIYAQMRTWVGDWEAHSASGRPIRVNYRMVAADTVLLQTYTTASGTQTLTVFHMDGQALIATHYCAQGNQPRLRLTAESSAQAIEFAFMDASNLPDPSQSHLHHLEFQPVDANQLTEIETYTSDGTSTSDVLHFRRVPDSPSHTQVKGDS